MASRRWLVGLALGSVLLANGCNHCCKRPQCGPSTGGPPSPIGGTLPPQGIPFDAPPTMNAPPPRVNNRAPEVLLPARPPSSSNYAAPQRSATLLEPSFDTPPPAVQERKPLTKTPPPAAFDDGASPLPIGISSFAQVKEGVSAGLRPDLDGLDWLNSKQCKTVVFLRGAKDDDSSDRKQVEKRGMKYQSIVVASDSINQATVAEFTRLVNDSQGRSAFIYDLDGKRAGVMWYLYFRTSELLNDEEARLRAGRYGLKDKGDAEQVQLWTAVQKFLADRNS